MTGRFCNLPALLLATASAFGVVEAARGQVPDLGRGMQRSRQNLPAPVTVESYPRDPRVERPSTYPRDREVEKPKSAGQGGEGHPAADAADHGADKSSVFRSGEELLKTTVEALESQTSISVHVQQEIHLFDEHIVRAGTYEQGTGRPLVWRLELKMRDGSRQSLFEQLSDGRMVWLYERVADEQKLQKIDLERVSNSLKDVAAAQGSTPGGLLGWGVGGLPRLLEGLNQAFEFGPPTRASWKGQNAWRMEGVWRKAMLLRLLPDQKDKILRGQPELRKLPEQVPDRIVLHIGAADLFPLHIQYLRTPRPKFYEIWKSKRPRQLSSIEFFDRKMGMTIDPRRFIWRAGNLEAADATEAYLANVKACAEAIHNAATVTR